MKRLYFMAALSLCLLFSISAFGQTATPTSDESDDILKISTTLIQADITVTDKEGKIITDLKPEDFEIYENGKKQDITNFSLISVENKSKPSESKDSSNVPKNRNAIPIPPIKLKAEQVRRTYALVVDDLGLSFESVRVVQQSLKKFVNEQMQEGDLVALIRTGTSIGATQSFTSDKRQILAAVEKIRWNPQGRSGISPIQAIAQGNVKDALEGQTDAAGNEKKVEGTEEDKEFLEQITQTRNENFSIGTLGSLRYIIRGMRELSGRKSLMFFSEGLALTSGTTEDSELVKQTRIFDEMRVLADLANRSSVIIYTLDPRGLQTPSGLTAEDNLWDYRTGNFGSTDDKLQTVLDKRNDSFRESQESLRYLAYETGGVPFINQNSLGRGIRQAIADQSSYYLLGYQPDEETFDPKKAKFNKLEVKVTRPGLKVRYRSGFFGITDEKIPNVAQTPRQKLIEALTSPFGATGVNLSVYPVFQNEAKAGNLVQALIHINANDLSFSEKEGKRKASFDLVATTFGDNGIQLDSLSKNYTIEIGEKVYQNMLINGFVYNLTVPIKKAGAYQFRVALRDTASNKVGSASQFIEVPNFDKKISLSNLVLDNFTLEEWEKIKLGGNRDDSQRSVLLDAALRQFKRGTLLSYDYVIYNPKRSQQITTQIRLIKDGKVIYEEESAPFQTAGQTDLMRLPSSGAITLGKNLETGSYILQTIAIDKAAKEKSQLATQFVEFEIVQ